MEFRKQGVDKCGAGLWWLGSICKSGIQPPVAKLQNHLGRDRVAEDWPLHADGCEPSGAKTEWTRKR